MHDIILFMPIAPPRNINLMYANKHKLVFTWESSCLGCPAVQYIINASNCGECPATTAENTLTCNVSLTATLQTCTLTIKSLVLENYIGSASETALVAVKGKTL